MLRSATSRGATARLWSAALRPIYAAETEEAAQRALGAFEERWRAKYPMIARQWRSRWAEIVPFLAYPTEIRRTLYTTNVIESVNAQLRKVLRPKGHFPSDEAVSKILFLALQHAKVNWKAPIFWRQALAHFAVMFGDRLPA